MKKNGLVVIGAGITGLSTGIAWALNNDIEKLPCVIIEKEPKVGGMVTSFRRKGVLFDTAQMIPDSKDILEYLGVQIDFKKFEGYYFRIFLVEKSNLEPKIFNIPSSIEDFEKMLCNKFPEEANNIINFLVYIQKMYLELFYLKVEPNIFDLLKALIKCPKIIKNKDKTFKELYQSFKIKNSELSEILDAFAAFSALPSNQVSALMTVGAMNSTLQGCFRPKKGFYELPVAMEKRFKDLGGIILKKNEVNRILIENGYAIGVELSNGKKIFSENVVTTIDAKVSMKNLVGLDKLKLFDTVYAKKVENMKMSVSSMTISLGLDNTIDLKSLGFDCGYNVLTSGNKAFEEMHNAFNNNELLQSEEVFHCAVICPSLTTGGKPSLAIRVVPVPLSDWVKLRNTDFDAYKIKKEKTAQFYIDIVEKYMIPDLKKHITVLDVATPATFVRYSGSPTGSNYDMAPYTDNFGKTRLKMRTPIKNLYQPKFSHGIWACLQSGLQVVDMITNGRIMKGFSRYRKIENF